MKDIKVFVGDETINVLPETTLLEISKKYQSQFHYPILVAKMDNEIVNLSRVVSANGKITFYDRSSSIGNAVYLNSLKLLLIVSLKELFGDVEITTDFSIDNGVFCNVYNQTLTKKELLLVEDKMKEISREGLDYIKVSVSRMEAIKYFKQKKQLDKVSLLRYISNTYISLYSLSNTYDYFFGTLANNTNDIDDFKIVVLGANQFLLCSPTISNPKKTRDYYHRPKLFETYIKYQKWGKNIGITTGAELNSIVTTGKYAEIIRIAEAHYDSQLADIAEDIYKRRNKPKIILLAGPSSSGKTTTSKKLAVYLRARGFTPHTIAMDDYFLDRVDTPLDENGEKNFENIEALDLKLFNNQMKKLLSGEKIELPEYDFIEGRKKYKDRCIELKETNILIVEGIHGLNDKVCKDVERNQKYKIFVSPLTLLNIDDHNQIHTTDTRKLRRIIRDNKYRGYNASDTLKQWAKIAKGEEKNIYPYQDDIDNIINTALIYEWGVLKTYAEPLLFSVDENNEMYPEAIRLINILRNFLPIPSDLVPKDSLLREFIGGSEFSE